MTARKRQPARKLRVLVLMHPDLIPPAEVTMKGEELAGQTWKTEHDILRTLGELGHESMTLGIRDELNLRVARPEEETRMEFTTLLTVQTMNYLHSGRHRVAL